MHRRSTLLPYPSRMAVVTLGVLLAGAVPALARAWRPAQIPNGDVFSCSACHLSEFGGGPRTPFGEDVLMFVAPGSFDEFWGPELAALDSDCDGRTNGEELQDPLGEWRPGDPPPGDPSKVTHPGVPDEPIINHPPEAVIRTDPDPPVVGLPPGGTAAITLDGSDSTDGNGGCQGLSFLWEKVEGPEGDVIRAPMEPATEVEFSEEGEYVYRLTVDDGQAEDNTDSAEVMVKVRLLEAPLFRRGNSNADAALDISDAVFTLNFLFAGGTPPPCLDAADSNDDGVVDISDAVYLLNFLFAGGRSVPPPAETCGPDPTADGVDCAAFPPCA